MNRELGLAQEWTIGFRVMITKWNIIRFCQYLVPSDVHFPMHLLIYSVQIWSQYVEHQGNH